MNIIYNKIGGYFVKIQRQFVIKTVCLYALVNSSFGLIHAFITILLSFIFRSRMDYTIFQSNLTNTLIFLPLTIIIFIISLVLLIGMLGKESHQPKHPGTALDFQIVGAIILIQTIFSLDDSLFSFINAIRFLFFTPQTPGVRMITYHYVINAITTFILFVSHAIIGFVFLFNRRRTYPYDLIDESQKEDTFSF